MSLVRIPVAPLKRELRKRFSFLFFSFVIFDVEPTTLVLCFGVRCEVAKRVDLPHYTVCVGGLCLSGDDAAKKEETLSDFLYGRTRYRNF